MEERGAKKPRESSKSEEESNMSGREWLKKFNTIKVRLPWHLKPVVEKRHPSSGAKLTGCRMTSGLAGLEAKKQLNKLHEFQNKSLCLLD